MPSDPRDYKLDLSKDKQAGGFDSTKLTAVSLGSKHQRALKARPYLQALFTCCNVYQRIYRSANGKRYDGACPRCGKRVRFVVSAGGTTSRSFVVE